MHCKHLRTKLAIISIDQGTIMLGDIILNVIYVPNLLKECRCN